MVRLESMSIKNRNQRLYEYLRDLGLFVAVTPDPDDPMVIDSITVSMGKPKVELIPFDSFPDEKESK